MTEQAAAPRVEVPERLHDTAAVIEDLMTGGRRLRGAFLQSPTRFAGRAAPLIGGSDTDAGAVLIRSGFAYRSCALGDGRRAILEILVPGDMAGLDHIVLSRPLEEITAAGRVGYQALGAGMVRALMADPIIALRILASIAEARWRADRLAASIGRLDAQARISVLLLDIHDRLCRRGLIGRPSYTLPLTQEQIADHVGLALVHVNRALRRLREEGIVLVDHQVVIIMDIDRLRQIAQRLPQAAEMPELAELPEPEW